MCVPISSHGGTTASIKLERPDDGAAPPDYMDHVVLPAAAPYDPCAKRNDDTVDHMRIWRSTSHTSAAPPQSGDNNTASCSAGEKIDLELRLYTLLLYRFVGAAKESFRGGLASRPNQIIVING
jgi:hypothetical protein